MSILPPWPRATGKYAARSTGLGRHQGASGDIMFDPWAAYFPVSLCQGCNIVKISSSMLTHIIIILSGHFTTKNMK